MPPVSTQPDSTPADPMPPVSTPDADVLDAILRRRRSVREFDPSPLSADQLHRLLWAAQGVTGPEGRRTAPSPHRSFGLEVLAVTQDGLLAYEPLSDSVSVVAEDDRRASLRAAVDQDAVTLAPLTIVLAGCVARQPSAAVDQERAMRYLALEAGHAGQNMLLEAAALGLAAVVMGAFDDAAVHDVLGLDAAYAPLELVAVGYPNA